LRGYIDREVFGLDADPAEGKEQYAVAYR
jgi:hypothetical protein